MKTAIRLPEVAYPKLDYRKPVTFRLPPQLLKDVDDLAKKADVTNTRIVELALQEFVKHTNAQSKSKK